MASKFHNKLSIDIDVFFRYKKPDDEYNRRGIASGGHSHNSRVGRSSEVTIDMSGLSKEFELHVELPYLTVKSKKKGVKIFPGGVLGNVIGNVQLMMKQRQSDGEIVYVFIFQIEKGSPLNGDEPQVLHPEDSPIIDEDDD